MAAYAMLFGGGAYIMELMNGIGAIRYLRPDYPYDELVMWPSLFYMLGFMEYRYRYPSHDGAKSLSDDVESDPSHE